MAAAVPIFSTKDQIKKSLRLGGMPKDADGDVILDNAIRIVRTGLRDAIGQGRIEAILGTAYTEEPTSDAQHLRLLATVTEADWVQYRLLMSTSVRVPDTTSGRLQTFQDEGFDRSMLYEERQILMRSLWEQIQTALLQLRGTDPIGDGPPLTKSSGSIVGAESPMIARSSIL